MATVAVIGYLQEVFTQSSLINTVHDNVCGNETPVSNNSCTYKNESLSEVTREQVDNLLNMYTTLPLTSAAHFGLATGLLLALGFNSRLPTSLKGEFRASDFQKWAEGLLLRVVFGTACLLLAVTVAPLIAVVFFVLAFYRQFVHLLLSTTSSSFAGLLEGTDAVWALEDDNSKSIINVLAIFEVEIFDNNFKPQLMTMLRKLMRTRILISPESCPKFWQYRRRSSLGYFYWERQDEVRVEEHIQYMTQEDDVVNQRDPESSNDLYYRQDYYGMSESVLKNLVSALANSPLPAENAASWEILIGRDPILEDLPSVDPFQAMEEGIIDSSMRCRRYPVLFRVHHSMGDGVALIKLLLEALADKKDMIESDGATITTRIVEDFQTNGLKPLRRRSSLIRSVSGIPCAVGKIDFKESLQEPIQLESDPEFAREVEECKLATSILGGDTQVNVHKTNYMPIAIAVRSPSQEFDELLFDDGPRNNDIGQITEQDIFSYPATEGFVTIADAPKTSAVTGLAGKMIYFFKEKDLMDDGFEKLRSYSPPIPVDHCPFLRDDSPPRCVSPLHYDTAPPSGTPILRLPPRCHDPLPKVLSDSPLVRCRSPLQKLLREDSIPRCPSPVPPFDRLPSLDSPKARFLSDSPKCQSPFLKDNCPLKGKPLHLVRNDTPIPRDSPHHGHYSHIPMYIRSESPVPQIHRKQYPHLWNDTPPSSGNSSPTLKDELRTLCNTPFTRSKTPVSGTPTQTQRCESPFQRFSTPLPRCSSPFQRSISPLPRNDNPIPRCNSPFLRSSTPLVVNNVSRLRSISPLPGSSSPLTCSRSPLLRSRSALSRNSTPVPPHSLEQINDIRRRLISTDGYKEENRMPSPEPEEKSEFYIKGDESNGESQNKSGNLANGFLKLLDSINHRPAFYESILNYLKGILALVFAPATLINQTLMRGADINPLHGQPLSGEKVVAWYVDPDEEDESVNALHMIKRIKSRVSDAKFSDVFLSALSSSLETYFIGVGCDDNNLPDTVCVVVPVRMTTEEDIELMKKLSEAKTINDIKETDGERKLPTMENRFSVALLNLPITNIPTNTKIQKSLSSIGRLREVCKHTDLLRKSPDYQINYWLMRVVSTFLPLPLLAPVLNSTQSTMVVSNLLGPPEKLELGGYKLKDLVFWVPNRGTTGVGVSVLSYAGRLQMGIVADRSLISAQEDADMILEGIVLELQRLDDFTAPVAIRPMAVEEEC